jgi:hypothetical protein
VTEAGVIVDVPRCVDPASSGVFALMGVTRLADAGVPGVAVVVGAVNGVVDAGSIGVFADGLEKAVTAGGCV